MFYEPVWDYDEYQLVKRPDTPNYHIYWTPRTGERSQRKSTGTSDLQKAKQRLIDFAKPRLRPTAKPEDELDLLEILVDYVEPIIRNSRSRQCGEVGALKHWMMFFDEFHVRTVADLTVGMQEAYMEWRFKLIHERGYKGSPATVGRDMRVMRAALNRAWKYGILEHKKYVKSLPEPPSRPTFIFPEEAKRLLKECEQTPHLWLFVMVALHTLQRPNAIFALRVEQVKFNEGLIDFLPAEGIQTRKRRPVVPISETLWPLLEEAVADSMTGYVIEHDDRPINSVRTAFNKARDRAGLPPEVTPYTLRHTGATLLLSLGVPIREVSGMLGHTEQQTTELYGKHHPEFLKKARAGVDRLFGNKHDVLIQAARSRVVSEA